MQEYTYGELYSVGEHGDIFEVSSVPAGLTPSADIRGKRVTIRTTKTIGSTVIVDPDKLFSNDSKDIILPTGNWTGAKFRKVDQFISIPFYTAMERLQRGHNVYYKTREGYTRLTTDTYVDGLTGIVGVGFDDLIDNIDWYYKK